MYIGKGLTHRDYFQQSRDNTPFCYDWFDSSFSGPVYILKIYNGKNRTFLLTTFGGFLQSGGVAQQRLAVPTESMINGDFSFGGQGPPIYNPFTTRQNAAGAWVRDPFPGNRIPARLIDPVAKNFIGRNAWKKPTEAGIMTATGPTQNFVAYPLKYVHRYRWDEKVDHQFSEKHKIFGRYSQVHEPLYYNGGISGRRSRGDSSTRQPNSRRQITTTPSCRTRTFSGRRDSMNSSWIQPARLPVRFRELGAGLGQALRNTERIAAVFSNLQHRILAGRSGAILSARRRSGAAGQFHPDRREAHDQGRL